MLEPFYFSMTQSKINFINISKSKITISNSHRIVSGLMTSFYKGESFVM